MYKCKINALKVPSLEQLAAGEQPYVILSWPKGVALPEHVVQGLRDAEYIGIPSCSLNTPWNGAAVSVFKKIAEQMEAGKRFTIGVDFDVNAVKLTGKKSLSIALNADAVHLNKVEEVEPVFVGAAGDAADDELAKAINKFVTEATRARLAARITPSGSVIEDTTADAAEGVAVGADIPFA